MPKIASQVLPTKPKEKYRLSNWSAYNEGLKQRGSLILWLSEEVAQQWYDQGQAQKGGPFTYSNDCILLLLTLKVSFKLAFRQLQGLCLLTDGITQTRLTVPPL